MEVLSAGKKHTQALEMVSEEEEEVEAAESEHEEGEICTEEEEEEEEGEVSLSSCPVFHTAVSSYNAIPSYQTHVAFPERRTNKKFPSAAVASEVVIYDDSGRTAIFTSPKKKRLSSYPRRSEGSRQHVREGPRRKDKEVERGRRHHSSSAAVPEKWPKVTRRVDSKGSGVSEEVHSHPHKGKEVRGGQRVRHSRQSSPESTSGSSSSSSSCSSTSSSSSVSYSLSEEESDVASVSPCKGRGVGKTTFIKKVVGRLQEGGLTCQGFYTEEVRQEGSRTGFDVVTLEGQRGILARVSPEDSVRQGPRVGKYAVDVASFESLALPALHTELSRPAVLVLDEVGKMEMFSDDFVKGVRQAISSPSSTILATIPIPKGKPIPLVEEIRRNHSFLVVHLTRSNRDDPTLQEKIMNILRASLKI